MGAALLNMIRRSELIQSSQEAGRLADRGQPKENSSVARLSDSCDVTLPNCCDEPFEIPRLGFLESLRLQGMVAQQRRL